MCLTTTARVLAVDEARGAATVETDGRRSEISLAPIVLAGGAVHAGDWVLLHTGLAIAVITEREAREQAEFIAALSTRGGTEP